MVLDRLPADPGVDRPDTARCLLDLARLSLDELAVHRFSPEDIVALTDLILEHFAADSFVAEQVIDFITREGDKT
jgi:hypothetical protein